MARTRGRWVLVSREKHLIEYIDRWPKGAPSLKAVPHRPRWAQRFTGKRVRLYYPPHLWRYDCVFNFKFGGSNFASFVVHGKYYGAIAQVWRVKQDTETAKIAFDNLVTFLGEFLGYDDPDEWWFSVVTAAGTGWNEEDWDEKLLNQKYMAVENEDGVPVETKWEDLS